MKYGIVYRKTTKNIGDDIQAYAASQWLPSVDYQIDLESLDTFVAEDDEPVAAIMSAWYMWAKWHWPPSKHLYPLWIGLHYTDGWRNRHEAIGRDMPSKFEYLASGPGKEYLTKYGKIGCRDPYTKGKLDELGIDSYFSGCVTLTLQRDENLPKPKEEYVVLVGVGRSVEKAVRKQLAGTGIGVEVVNPMRPQKSTELSWEERKAQVQKMLAIYQNAKCVLTFRLHCALPCLALGTPVLLVRPNFSSIRFQPYKDWMPNAYPQEVIDGKFAEWMKNPPPNPDTYKETRENLIKLCNEFVEKAKNETRKASEIYESDYGFDETELLRWRVKTMSETLDNYLEETRIDIEKIKELNKKLKGYENKGKDQDEKLIVVENCASVRFTLKVREIYSNWVFAYRRRRSRRIAKKAEKKKAAK